MENGKKRIHVRPEAVIMATAIMIAQMARKNAVLPMNR
jgi:hypothetical protein